MIHFSFEAIFLYYSVFGRTVATSPGILPEMGMFLLCRHWTRADCVIVREYSLADLRWAVADPTVYVASCTA